MYIYESSGSVRYQLAFELPCACINYWLLQRITFFSNVRNNFIKHLNKEQEH